MRCATLRVVERFSFRRNRSKTNHSLRKPPFELPSETRAQGFPPEDLPFIFDRFWRGDRSRSERMHSGLGLAIAKQLVRAHGGTIVAQSVVGTGSSFVIELPADGEDQVGEQEPGRMERKLSRFGKRQGLQVVHQPGQQPGLIQGVVDMFGGGLIHTVQDAFQVALSGVRSSCAMSAVRLRRCCSARSSSPTMLLKRLNKSP